MIVISGAIMIEIHYSVYLAGGESDKYDINVGTIWLFGNGLTSAFKLAGVCIVAILSNITELEESGDNICSVDDYSNIENRNMCCKQIGGYFAILVFISSVV